jgi:hypothetical protein
MIELTVTNKDGLVIPKLRYSYVKNYSTCPKMYLLSTTKPQLVTPQAQNNMSRGNLFEFFVTGATSDPRDINKVIKDNKGRFDGMQKKTVEKIKAMAIVTKRHILETYEAQLVLHYDKDPRYIFESNIDLVSLVQFDQLNNGQPFAAIVDLKYTASIEEVWNNKSTKEDFLQSIIYVWQVYEATGKMLPFVYIVSQIMHDEVLIKPFLINVTKEDFAWFKETYIERILSDKLFIPKATPTNCLGFRSTKGKCRYLNHCEDGKRLITSAQNFDFKDLEK